MALNTHEPDFIATIRYLKTIEGGRESPVSSGYKPQLKFDFETMETSGHQTFVNDQIVYPGDTVEAEVRIPSDSYFSKKLTENMKFVLKEGPRLIATGTITRILNINLKKQDKLYGSDD